ncbi:RDD family protein [Leptospira harrisiae]|uniref:RDD domain-containing protein n=1 Tax=Leptospira harrisiae TaxID=2023189 RepID=A0A2N0AK20_9LEPT|nr:RDD family protein [Leptospira harrisiae]PJZ84603.1 hypothetical protein CH364_11375 [Leptospira harrisiae]PKA07343.1 hypothetical protein CH366_13075 [Leptospira harrisiae]
MNSIETTNEQEFVLASLGKRFLAHIVDFLILSPFIGIHLFLIFKSMQIGLIYYFIATIVYSIIFISYRIFLTFKLGGTFGKLAVKIKVVNSELGTLSLKEAFLREVPHILIYLFFIINVYFMVIFFNQNSEKLSNLIFSEYYKEINNQEKVPNLSLYYYLISILFILFNKMKKTPHDFLANSIVISK